MKNKLKFGIIGCSRIAENSFLPSILQSKNAELKMIGSRTEKKAIKFAEKFKCNSYGTYEEVLENKEIDAIYISTPIGLHEKWCIEGAKHGKNILCEKSLSDSFTSAVKIIKTAKKNKIRIMEGFMFRFHPSHQRVREIFSEKQLGKIFAFYARYGFPSIPKTDIRYKKQLGGGILNDAGCYPVCASRMFYGKEPKEVICHFQIDKKSGVDERMSAMLKFSSTEISQIVSGYNLVYQNEYSLWGTNGAVNLSRAFNIPNEMNPIIKIESQNKTKIKKTNPANHFLLMIENFSKIVLKKEKAQFDFENEIINQAKVLEALRKSAKNHQVIKLSTIKP